MCALFVLPITKVRSKETFKKYIGFLYPFHVVLSVTSLFAKCVVYENGERLNGAISGTPLVKFKCNSYSVIECHMSALKVLVYADPVIKSNLHASVILTQ